MKMFVTFNMRFEDRLEGASNFIPWKERVTLLLEEFDLWSVTKEVVTIPTDPDALVEHNRKNVKAKCILVDGMKDHLIPHVTSKKNAFDMWAALIKLFQSDIQNRKMVLREKLRNTKMIKTENVTSYLTQIS